jgi:hypothetical protein
MMFNVRALGAFPKFENIARTKINLAESQYNGDEKEVWQCSRRPRQHQVTVTVSTGWRHAGRHHCTVQVALPSDYRTFIRRLAGARISAQIGGY